MRDRIFRHLFIGLKSDAFDNTLGTRNMDIRIRIDAVFLLVPFEFLCIELLALQIECMHVATQGP